MSPTTRRLVEYCRRRADDNLRTVAGYDATEEELSVAYFREDLRPRYTDEQYELLVGKLYDTHRSVVEIGGAGAPIGGAVASVHYFENGFVIQLVVTEKVGYVVTFDSVVGSSLASFIDECLERVGSSSVVSN